METNDASYIDHLSTDPVMAALLQQQQPVSLSRKSRIFLQLCKSIMSQQLSTRVAAVIYERFITLFPGGDPAPEDVLNIPSETLRGIGLSQAKTRYVQEVCRFALESGMSDEQFNDMTDEEIISYLTPIKGVGRWTVEMLLIFTLAREDVFAVDDLGIQQAMISLYGIRGTDQKKRKVRMARIADKWKPFRTYACLHLWRWKDEGSLQRVQINSKPRPARP